MFGAQVVEPPQQEARPTMVSPRRRRGTNRCVACVMTERGSGGHSMNRTVSGSFVP